MYNRIILIGNLTRDPEVRYLPSSTAVVNLRIAVTTRQKQGEEFKEETLFIDVVAFGKQAESCGQYLTKGSAILVEGRLRERKWEIDGVQKSKFEVMASSIKFMPRREAKPTSSSDNFGDIPPEEITDTEPF